MYHLQKMVSVSGEEPVWIGCALDRKFKEVVTFNVGGRSIEMLSATFRTVNSSAPSKVYTDCLVHFLKSPYMSQLVEIHTEINNLIRKSMDAGKSMLCFIAGAMAGAVAALFLAPDSGENTRAKIRKGAADLKGRAKEKVVEGLGIIEEALEEQ